jgi:hypothetical protein
LLQSRRKYLCFKKALDYSWRCNSRS